MSRSFDSILSEIEEMDDERYDVFLTKLAEYLDRRYEVASREVEGALDEGPIPGALSMGEDEWAVDAIKEQMLYRTIVNNFDSDQEEFVGTIRGFRDQVESQTVYSDAGGEVEEYVQNVFVDPLEESREI